MKPAILVGLAIFSYGALAQVSPQDKAAADRVQCEKVVVNSPGEAAGAKDKCLQDRAIKRHRDAMETCLKSAQRMARPTIPQQAFYKDCMYVNGYRYE